MSTKAENWFSASELSRLGKSGVADLPTTDPGCTGRAQREKWDSRESPCMGGKKGLRTEYCPPDGVLDQVQSFLASNPGFFSKSKTHTKADLAKASREVFGDIPSRLIREQAEYAVRENDALLAPNPEGRMLMLQMVIRVSEQRLKEPPAPDAAKKIVDLADAWLPYCAQHPEMRQRLLALKASAALFV